ncbi:MAG TPA: hypothetical protein VJ798_06020 [Rhizomicrobium sp.]|nr:hypothetical protein [Rhizomicrobium sp.]
MLVHLPLNPWRYIALWVAGFVLGGAMNFWPGIPTGFFAVVALMWLQLEWVFQSARYAWHRLGAPDATISRHINLLRFLQIVSVGSVFIMTLAMNFSVPFLPPEDTSPFLVVGVLSAFIHYWLSARALRKAEGSRSGLRTIGTFLMFFYSPFFAPLIFVRLKRLPVLQAA